MLILGCGHPDRGDDAAGLIAAERLGVRAMSGDPLDLMTAWEGADEVIVIDAVVSGARPGTLHCWDARTAPLEHATFRFSTHGFGVWEAIEIARALGRLPPDLTIYGIEGACFDPGAALTADVRDGIERLVSSISAKMDACGR